MTLRFPERLQRPAPLALDSFEGRSAASEPPSKAAIRIRDQAIEVVARQSKRVFDHCANAWPIDPQTGFRTCELEAAGGECLCAAKQEQCEAIAREIRQLSLTEEA